MLIEVSPDDLAGCRYAISPLIETTSALRALQSVVARDRIVGATPAMSPEEPPLDLL